MTALATTTPPRRGACPGLSAPMPTGDGLLVRLRPIGTVSLAAFKELCGAARAYGNGVVEITARGSIQVRGLAAASAPRFADTITSLGIAAEDGVPVISNALAGLDSDELIDAGAFAADLRRALARTSLPGRLAPKVSVAIDGGGALKLGSLSADIRMSARKASDDVMLDVYVGGGAGSAVPLGAVAAANGVETAVRLLEVIAQWARGARARDILAAGKIDSFREALSSCSALCQASTSYYEREEQKDVDGREKPGHDGNPIGTYRLRDESFACGIGLAFGHSDTPTLQQLADAAEAASAHGVRIAPGRALLAVGLTGNSATTFTPAAERLGFITRADDSRRHVIACAGAPICASAHIAARTMAPSIAEIAACYLDDSFKIHISGCAKGCAHPRPAALTIVGTPAGYGVVADGSVRDQPFAVVAADQLPTAILNIACEARHV
jgi:precorrin-3B synthase